MSANEDFPGILKGKMVAVLMGGPGSEREISLRSGAGVTKALREAGALVEAVDVAGTTVELPAGCDLAFNMIHGTFGEDGGVQAMLEEAGVPYTGEGVSGSRTAFDKILSKRGFDAAGVPTAPWEVVTGDLRPRMPLPFVVKAPRQGSSVGVHIVKTSAELDHALEDCFRFGSEVLVEAFTPGRELTVGVLGTEALPIIEIVPKQGFYDYQNKYTKGASEYFVPAPLSAEEERNVIEASLAAHRALGLEVYSRVDLLLDAGGQLNVLEINTIPGMTETSLLPKAAAARGISFAALCERIAGLSMRRFARGGAA